jgi:hypothetical protein
LQASTTPRYEVCGQSFLLAFAASLLYVSREWATPTLKVCVALGG